MFFLYKFVEHVFNFFVFVLCLMTVLDNLDDLERSYQLVNFDKLLRYKIVNGFQLLCVCFLIPF